MLKSTKQPKKNIQKIYLDYAASALSTSSNPGAIHQFGLQEKVKLENARGIVAKILHAHNNEIIFTSGATESNNLAILGLVQNFKQPHIVTTNIEHASVLEVCKYLEKTKQAEVTYVEVEDNGIVDPKKIKKAFRPNTVLVSVMYANNEIGTVQPIREIAKEIRHWNKKNNKKTRLAARQVFFHMDAVQAVNYLPIRIPELGVDLMSINSAKIYGPKGVGALYVKKNTLLSPIMFGGDQEMGFRPGTENVASILEFTKALQITEKMKEKETTRLIKLRDYFIAQLTHSNMGADIGMILNGDKNERLPNNVNITIPNIPSDLLVIELSAKGIMASAKSACKSGDGKASYVIQAIRPEAKPARNASHSDARPHDSQQRVGQAGGDTNGSLRFSLGRETTKSDIDYTVQALSEILTKLKKWYN